MNFWALFDRNSLQVIWVMIFITAVLYLCDLLLL